MRDKIYFFLDRVARLTGDGDFLAGEAGAAAFLPPRFGAGDFLAGDAFVFFAGAFLAGACVSSGAGAAFFPPLVAFLAGLAGFSGLPDFCTPLDLFLGDSSAALAPLGEGDRFRLAGDEAGVAGASAGAALAALPRPRVGFGVAALAAATLPRPFLTGLGDALAGEAGATASASSLATSAALTPRRDTFLAGLLGASAASATAAAARPLFGLALSVSSTAGALWA